MDTLAVRLTLPTTKRVADFHRQVTPHARRTGNFPKTEVLGKPLFIKNIDNILFCKKHRWNYFAIKRYNEPPCGIFQRCACSNGGSVAIKKNNFVTKNADRGSMCEFKTETASGALPVVRP
jgi:hypothetical protein